MNPRLGHPNLARAPNTLVNIGVIFYTRGGERLHDLALKFYTSVSQLLQDNADLVCIYDSYMRACVHACTPIIPPTFTHLRDIFCPSLYFRV